MPPIANTLGIQNAANDMITNTGQILYATAPDHDDRMFLKIVPLTGDIAYHLETVGKPDAGHLSKCRVGLLRRGGVNTRADPPFLRAALHGGHLIAGDGPFARLADQLVDRRHNIYPSVMHKPNTDRPGESTKQTSAGLSAV